MTTISMVSVPQLSVPATEDSHALRREEFLSHFEDATVHIPEGGTDGQVLTLAFVNDVLKLTWSEQYDNVIS